jgi:hypothetical protein
LSRADHDSQFSLISTSHHILDLAGKMPYNKTEENWDLKKPVPLIAYNYNL